MNDNIIENCNFTLNLEADGATQLLAGALNAQAEANKAIAKAMLQLAMTLKPIDACAVRIVDNKVEADKDPQS